MKKALGLCFVLVSLALAGWGGALYERSFHHLPESKPAPVNPPVKLASPDETDVQLHTLQNGVQLQLAFVEKMDVEKSPTKVTFHSDKLVTVHVENTTETVRTIWLLRGDDKVVTCQLEPGEVENYKLRLIFPGGKKEKAGIACAEGDIDKPTLEQGLKRLEKLDRQLRKEWGDPRFFPRLFRGM